MRPSTRWAIVESLLLAGLFGCGSREDGVRVHGHVTYRDQAITNGALTFFPVGGRPVTATLATGGAYECRLPPGEYRVVVTVGVQLPEGWKEGDAVPAQAIELPGKYTSRLDSTLKATVAADQEAPLDFALQ